MRETLWLGSRYGLAAVITMLVIAALPCLVGVVVGLITLVVGAVSTVVLPFGADPPIFGLAFGLTVIAISIMGMIITIVIALVIAFILSAGIITPIALMIRLVSGRIKSPSLAKLSSC